VVEHWRLRELLPCLFPLQKLPEGHQDQDRYSKHKEYAGSSFKRRGMGDGQSFKL
jgi:hypothetical protein